MKQLYLKFTGDWEDGTVRSIIDMLNKVLQSEPPGQVGVVIDAQEWSVERLEGLRRDLAIQGIVTEGAPFSRN